jgi:uncharacterized protein
VRVPVTDLVGRPGESRHFTASVTRDRVGDDPWGPADEALTGEIDLDLHLDSVVEGILVHGDVAFDLVLDCARCLEPVRVHRDASVSELFQDPDKLDEGDEIEPGYELIEAKTAIDLERMLHDVVVLDLPVRVHCERPDCTTTGAGDADVALRTEDEDAARPDPRWAKLADLDLPAD